MMMDAMIPWENTDTLTTSYQFSDLWSHPYSDQESPEQPPMSSFELDLDWTTPPLSPDPYAAPLPELLEPLPDSPSALAALASPAWKTELELQLRALDARSMFLHGPRYGYESEAVNLVHRTSMDETHKNEYYMPRAEVGHTSQYTLAHQMDIAAPSTWDSTSFGFVELSDDEVNQLTNGVDNISLSTSSADYELAYADHSHFDPIIEAPEQWPIQGLTAHFQHLDMNDDQQ
ncbi:hypothetical protein D9757_008769 [Collybiopsis confluens]|uniref:Uncharacterized protein n=1 Tax=Collybiopsis confluens TaxID=2823264 RepID=A0A8H5H5K7_9AGAR|nr:hypothetical protein D9757_008769 [Collybiopsis confluens]